MGLQFLLNTVFHMLIDFTKTLLPKHSHEEINDFVQARVLVDQRLHDRAVSKCTEPVKAELGQLRQQAAEAMANYMIGLATQGIIQADYSEFATDPDVRIAVAEANPDPDKEEGENKDAAKTGVENAGKPKETPPPSK